MDGTAPKLDAGTRLAVDRTRLAHERTLMAWVRTATSLISFGFTIYKFFQFEAGKGAIPPSPLVSPRQFAMIMIGTGLAALALSLFEHHRSMQALRAEYGGGARGTTAGIVAGIVAVMGLLAFLTTLFRG